MSEVAVAGLRPRGVASPAAKGTASRHDFVAEVHHGAEAYQTLLADWRRLADLQAGTILFQTPLLLATWARYFARNERMAALVTLLVRHEGRPVLIWPLMIKQRALVRIARAAGAPIGQYDEILADPDTDAKAALSAALTALKEAEHPDVVLFERVRADSLLCAALQDATPIGNAEAAPYTDLSSGLAAALAKRKSRVIKQQRKRTNRFAKAGSSVVALASDSATAEAWLMEALTLKRHWLRSTGRVSRAFIKAETGDCLAELARTLSHGDASPRMVVVKLSLDGRTAAIEAGFLHRGNFHLYLRAFAPEFAQLGPGNVLTQHMLEWCVENGVERYDMLAPRSRNKSEWKTGEVAVFDFALPTTLRGRLYAAAVPALLAPKLRDAFYALPAGLRSAIAGIVLKM